MLDFLVHNHQWIFSGIGVAVLAVLSRGAYRAIGRVKRRSMKPLWTTKQYLDSIYKLYEMAGKDDRIRTCTSSWPLDPSREHTLRHTQATSVAFLGPIRVGISFLGVLWRYGISLERSGGRLVFLHREVPGLKFVVAGSNVVISNSTNEKPSQTGAVWRDHKELASLLCDRFDAAAQEAVSLEDRLAVLVGERVQATPRKSLTVPEILDFLTQGTEYHPAATAFPYQQRLDVMTELLKQSLPRNSLVYRPCDNSPDSVLFAPRSSEEFALPAIRICDTLDCNLRCAYCPQHGENFGASRRVLPFRLIEDFVRVAREYGFTHFRFTGGEPLGRCTELFRCIGNYLADLPNGNVSVATNGERLTDATTSLRKFPGVRLKVSLDTLDEVKFRSIARVNSDTFTKILQGLEAIKMTNAVGINTVVSAINVNDVDSLVDYSEENGFYIKLMDLNWYDDQEPRDFYNTHYVRLTALSERLRRKYPCSRSHTTIGGYGIPMTDYIVNDKTFVRMKDHTRGSTYAPYCTDSCPFFPCQEGLYQITLTVDGRLRACRHRPDLAEDISDALARRDRDMIWASIDSILNHFFRPAFIFVRDREFAPPL